MGQGNSRHSIPRPTTLTEQPIMVEKPVETSAVIISAPIKQPVEALPKPPPLPANFSQLAANVSIRDVPLAQLNLLGDFDLAGLETEARVMSTYDGDTCHLAFFVSTSHLRKLKQTRHGPKCAILCAETVDFLINRRVRLDRLDAAELRPSSADGLGQKARQVLVDRLARSQDLVWVSFGKNDKWGRPLVTLFDPSETIHDFNHSINFYLLNYRDSRGDILFKPYNGGKREEF